MASWVCDRHLTILLRVKRSVKNCSPYADINSANWIKHHNKLYFFKDEIKTFLQSSHPSMLLLTDCSNLIHQWSLTIFQVLASEYPKSCYSQAIHSPSTNSAPKWSLYSHTDHLRSWWQLHRSSTSITAQTWKCTWSAMKVYIQEALDQGFIVPCTFSASAAVIFLEKKGGRLCPCIDYQRLNNITVKYPYL